MKILGSKFWALGGLNQKSKKTVLYSFCHGELMAKKWLDSIEKQIQTVNDGVAHSKNAKSARIK